MNRAEFIDTCKTLLDKGAFNKLRALVHEQGAEHADVVARALAAADARDRALRPGYYTVVLDEGGHVTFRVAVQKEDAKFAPGKMIVARLTGPNNEEDYQGCAFVRADGGVNVWTKAKADARLVRALDVLVGNPRAAGRGYAIQSGRCQRCGRLLTTPESVALGIGPDCATKD